MARGKYIYFMDADDEIKKTLLSDNIPLLENDDAETLIFSHREILENNKINHLLSVNI